MPSSAIRSFADPDEYAAAIRATRAELTVLERGRFAAKLTRIDLHRLWMQRFSENLPRVAHSANIPGRAIISFRTQLGPDLSWSGAEMLPTTMTRHNEGQDAYQRSSGPVHWAAMSLSTGDLAALGADVVGCDLTPPEDGLILHPPPFAMTKLLRLHAEAGRLAQTAPEIIVSHEAARGLEQALVLALLSCLRGGEAQRNTVAQRRHTAIMRRFRTAVEAQAEQPLYLTELCAAVGVSAGTLRNCCQEQLGMSPKKFLLLRRLHLANRALREADRTATTVTDIATRFGFWELGRFAVRYGLLFGEPPSATLRNSPDRLHQPAAIPLSERFVRIA